MHLRLSWCAGLTRGLTLSTLEVELKVKHSTGTESLL